MITALQLEMSLTLGDLIVTAGSVVAIVIAYFAIKAALATIVDRLEVLSKMVETHDNTLGEHGENLAALDAAVFGRRRQDAATKARDRERDRGARRLITPEGGL